MTPSEDRLLRWLAAILAAAGASYIILRISLGLAG